MLFCALAGKFSCFGELMSQPSRLAPNAAMDATVGQLTADGLATSATILVSNLLRTAAKCARAAAPAKRVIRTGPSLLCFGCALPCLALLCWSLSRHAPTLQPGWNAY